MNSMKMILLVFLLMLQSCVQQSVLHDDRALLWKDVAVPSAFVARTIDGGSGSGVVILRDADRVLVLTAAHVIGDGAATVLIVQHNSLQPGIVVRVDRALDLAIVRTGPWDASVAHLVTNYDLHRIGWGVRIVAYGHPLGEPQGVLTDGRITATDDDGYLRYSAQTYYGNSGGGVFAQIDGHWTLISIAQRIAYDGHVAVSHIGRGVRPDLMLEFLKGIDDVR